VPKHWVYKLTVEQVSLIFEANDLSCFIINRQQRFKDFIIEYNQLFNRGDDLKKLNSNRFLLKLYVKHLKLRAMYDALTNCEAENSKAEFKLMFKKEFETVDDLKLITNEADRLNDKMGMLNMPNYKKDGLSFSQLVIVVETSRGVNISRDTRLFEFYKMYEIELEKWHKT